MWTEGKVTARDGLTLRAFSPSDPPRIVARADFEAEQKAAGDPLMGATMPGGACWTLTEGPGVWSQPLACGGLEDLGHGRWSGWLYASDLSPRGWAMVARGFRMLRFAVEARRVELAVRAPARTEDWPLALRACRFAEALGLKREGLMRGWGAAGDDYYLYAGCFE